ncbi:MAG: hypothetical protein HUU20_15085 [Pirellulales bacterium]|nr:hypothetical protein [Pirellulales bacterium]
MPTTVERASGSNTDSVPTVAVPSGGYTTLADDGAEYRLTSDHRLLRRVHGSGWTVLDKGVVAYHRAPNGDVYLLNDRQELKRFQLGYLWSTLRTDVVSLAMDSQGAVYVLDNLNRVWTYAALDRYSVLPAIPEGDSHAALDVPTPGEIVRAARLAPADQEVLEFDHRTQLFELGPEFRLQDELDYLTQARPKQPAVAADAASAIRSPTDAIPFANVRIVVDRVYDTVDPPRTIPNVGAAQLHRVRYRCTIYSTSRFYNDAQLVVYIDHDHLHLFSSSTQPAGSSVKTPASNASSPGTAPTTTAVSNRPHAAAASTGQWHSGGPCLTTGPDGTIYKFGVLEGHRPVIGNGVGPYTLWRLVPGSDWQTFLFRSYAFAVGPDNTLYTLNEDHELQKLAPGSKDWVTLDRRVESIAMSPDGTLYALNGRHELRRLQALSMQWSLLDTGVKSFHMTSDGTVYELNDRQEFKRLAGDAKWTTLDTAAVSFAVADGDVVYELNGRGEFRRLTGPHAWKVLDKNMQSFTISPDGNLYALNDQHALKRLEGSERWALVDTGIRSYQFAPNGDLYALNDRHELKRQKLGYSWSTLQSGVQSFSIDVFGTAFVLDDFGRLTMYSSAARYDILPEIPAGFTPIALDPPSEADIVTAMAMDSGAGGQGRISYPDSLYNDVQYFPPSPGWPEFALSWEEASMPSIATHGQTLLEARSAAISASAAADSMDARIETEPYIPFYARGDHQRDFGDGFWNNVRITKELVSESIDPPRMFPNIGLAQMHHALFKVTAYGSTLVRHPSASHGNMYVNPDEIQVIFIDRDHLHPYVAGTPQTISASRATTAGAAVASSQVAAEASRPVVATVGPTAGPPVQRPVDQFAQSFVTAPDGTMYKLGRGNWGNWASLAVGSEPAPYFLWQLPANKAWTPIDYVYAFAVGPDSELYILNKDRELLTPALGPTGWVILDTGIQSFGLAQDGTVFALNDNHELRVFAPATKRWLLLETGVQWLASSPMGTIYVLNDRQELKQYRSPSQTLVVALGVQSTAMVEDGAIYALNSKGELERLREGEPTAVLARQVASFQIAPGGEVYVLDRNRKLMQLTSRDHWTVLDSGVATFQVSPNGDLYLISDQSELKRRKVGYSWVTLPTDAQSMTIYSDGSVYVRDEADKLTIYSSKAPYFTLGPLTGGDLESPTPPSDDEILRAANIAAIHPSSASGVSYASQVNTASIMGDLAVVLTVGDVLPMLPRLRSSTVHYAIPDLLIVQERPFVVKEPIFNEADPPRDVPTAGTARLHRIQYKCIIYYSTDVEEELTVYFDDDHFHAVDPLLWGGPAY